MFLALITNGKNTKALGSNKELKQKRNYNGKEKRNT